MTTHKEETIKVRGRNTRLYRGGEGPPLLFLHDTFCPSWLPIHQILADQFEVFVPTHPGCAGSEDGICVNSKKWRTLFFITSISARRFILISPCVAGASFGGWIAAEWAIRYSKTLRALILIDALGLRVPEAPAPDILSLDPAASRQVIFADPSSALALEVIPETPKPEEVVSVLLARQTLARFAWQFPDNPRLLRYLYRIKAPTLILWGGRDGFVSVAHGKAYHEGIAGSQLVILPNSGHLPHVESTETCAQMILKFLNQ